MLPISATAPVRTSYSKKSRPVARCLLGLLLLLAVPAQAQIFELPPPAEGQRHPSFGEAVALDGRRALVGASGEAVCGKNSGAVYVFERTPGTNDWRQTARLVPEDCRAGAFFGRTLDLDGDRAVVGASVEFFADEEPNVVFVFEREPRGTWRETARLSAGPKRGAFATSVSLSGDRLLATTRGGPDAAQPTGAAYVFERSADGRWQQTSRLYGSHRAEDGLFGERGALCGDRAVVTASTYFSHAPGSAYVFERDRSGSWQRTAHLKDVDGFYIAAALDSTALLLGESRAGHAATGRATLYRRDAQDRWQRATTLQPATPYASGGFGAAVSLSGDRALVSGYDDQLGFDLIDRVVYVFVLGADGRWQQRQILDIGEVGFGAALDHDGRWAIVGHVPGDGPGSAFVARLQERRQADSLNMSRR